MIVFVEGIDKSGKDTLVAYINELTNYEHYVTSRGPLSTLAYAKKFARKSDDFSYLQKISDDILFVYLMVDNDDFDVRCKITNEPKLNHTFETKLFDSYVMYFKTMGFDIKVYDTTYSTPYAIAKDIANYLRRKK